MSPAHDIIFAKADFDVPPVFDGVCNAPPDPCPEPDVLFAFDVM